MGSLGAPEVIVVFLVALIVLGPDRLPKAARQMGKAVAEFRRVTSGFQDEVRKAMDDAAGSSTSDAPVVSGKITGPDDQVPSRSTVPAEDLPPPPDDPSRN